MEFTPFAGLTALDQNDPITIDGASFLIENPRITDHLLQIGAVTHRHDGHAAHPSPIVALSGAAIPTGGQLAASGSFALTYTVLDQYGGETKSAPPLVVNTGGQIPTPGIGPTATVLTTSGGIMPAGAYYYGLTYTDGVGGETPIGPATFAYVDPGFASSSVLLSNLRAEFVPGVVDWRLWRSYEGADWHLVSEGSTSTFLDDGFDPPDNPARPPAQNTSGQQSSISVTIPTAGADPALGSGGTGIRIYLAPDTGFLDPCFYAQLPMASAGATFTIQSDTVSKGRPPKVSRSIPGAGKINYLTDIINTPAGGGGGGGGGGTSSPTGPALGVQQITASGIAIAANATTNITIAVPAWAEATMSRVVVGMCIQHADASKLAATLTDPVADTADLFHAGDWTVTADVGDSTLAIGDPDSQVYFVDPGQARLQVQNPSDRWFPVDRLGVDVNPPFGGVKFASRDHISTSFVTDNPSGNWTLAITESGGHTGTLRSVSLYLISREFEAIIPTPAPPIASAVGGSALAGAGTTFIGSGGVIVELAGTGDPTAGIKITGVGGVGPTGPQGPAGQGRNIAATGSGGVTPVNPAYDIEFTGSGGTGVAVQNLGGGSARVLISASGSSGPAGPTGPTGPTGPAGTGGGSTLGVSGSGGVGLITPVSDIEFTASGGTGVAVQNLGGGSARVLISASGIIGPAGPTGPTGPAGSSGGGGSIAISASAGASAIAPTSDIEFTASGGAGIGIQNLGGGSGRVSVYVPRLAGGQNGVIAANDLLVAAVSINTSNGTLTLSPAYTSEPAWVQSQGGALIPVSYGGGPQTFTSPPLPASTKYAVYGVEMDITGTFFLVKGADTSTQLNTAPLIATNTPSTTVGRLRIADFAIWNNTGTINFSDHTTVATQGTNWIDRRPWARGAMWTSGIITAGNYTTTSGALVVIDSARLKQRVECTGVPLSVRLLGMVTHSVTTNWIDFALLQDGSALAGARSEHGIAGAGNGQSQSLLDQTFVPSAGSHVYEPEWATQQATATLEANSTYGLMMVIEEITRQNVTNGTS